MRQKDLIERMRDFMELVTVITTSCLNHMEYYIIPLTLMTAVACSTPFLFSAMQTYTPSSAAVMFTILSILPSITWLSSRTPPTRFHSTTGSGFPVTSQTSRVCFPSSIVCSLGVTEAVGATERSVENQMQIEAGNYGIYSNKRPRCLFSFSEL